jgi:hypothetical protein
MTVFFLCVLCVRFFLHTPSCHSFLCFCMVEVTCFDLSIYLAILYLVGSSVIYPSIPHVLLSRWRPWEVGSRIMMRWVE